MLPTFDTISRNPRHKYTTALFRAFLPMLKGYKRIVDPFGGTGKISMILHFFPDMEIFPIELEPEWAHIGKNTIPGNALYLPFADSSIDAICTSPTYGNRMADKKSRPGQQRMSYADQLGRNLHPDNSGTLQWGDQYRAFHVQAWIESRRVLKMGGVFVLNIKNHIRAGKEQFVTEWHIQTLEALGFRKDQEVRIFTPSMRRGANSDKRIEYESVIRFILDS